MCLIVLNIVYAKAWTRQCPGLDAMAVCLSMTLFNRLSKDRLKLCHRASAPYVAGRQQSWLKIKCTRRQEFIIVGYSATRRGDRALGALYLGYRKDGALRYAGKVGTGFAMTSARELAERFKAIPAAKPNKRRGWARPNGAQCAGASPSRSLGMSARTLIEV